MDTDAEAREGADTPTPVGPVVASYQLRVTQRAHLTEAVEGGAEAKEQTILTNEAIAQIVGELLESITGAAITVRAERLDK